MSAPGQVGAGWGLRVLPGTLVALLFLGACPRGIGLHSWAVALELGLFWGCHGMFLIPEVTASPSSPLPGVPCA